MTNNKTMNNNNNILQNLKDAGCENSLIKQFMNLDKHEQLQLLAKHRSYLLNEIHKKQKQIDYLDYLVFSLNQKTN